MNRASSFFTKKLCFTLYSQLSVCVVLIQSLPSTSSIVRSPICHAWSDYCTISIMKRSLPNSRATFTYAQDSKRRNRIAITRQKQNKKLSTMWWKLSYNSIHLPLSWPPFFQMGHSQFTPTSGSIRGKRIGIFSAGNCLYILDVDVFISQMLDGWNGMCLCSSFFVCIELARVEVHVSIIRCAHVFMYVEKPCSICMLAGTMCSVVELFL